VKKKSKKLCIIPARGGSKRLPRKNVLPFLGKPMILHTIEAAYDCGLFDHILVSTEDREISEVVRKSTADLLIRPEELATDHATVVEVCLHALEVLSRDGFEPEFLCCLYATAPLRSAEDIKGTFEVMISNGATAAMALTHYPIPAWWAMKRDEQGFLSFMWPDLAEKTNNEVPELVVDNGSTYWVRTKTFLEEKTFCTTRSVGYVMPFHKSFDIDTSYDLHLTECVANH